MLNITRKAEAATVRPASGVCELEKAGGQTDRQPRPRGGTRTNQGSAVRPGVAPHGHRSGTPYHTQEECK